MRAVLAQLAPVPGDIAANVATVARVIAEHPGADLAVFPELFLPGYEPRTAATLALERGDPAFAPILDAARRHGVAVIAGFAERTSAGVANAAACIDRDGTWAGVYRKTHLFGDAERHHFVTGDAYALVTLAGVRTGPLICFDMEFPEPARALATAGAELLVSIAANMHPYGPDHALAARARALDNRRPHVYVNRVGSEGGLEFAGGSAACDARGDLLGALGYEPQVTAVELPLHPVATDVDYLAHVRHGLSVR